MGGVDEGTATNIIAFRFFKKEGLFKMAEIIIDSLVADF
jgi:hypothetical protein